MHEDDNSASPADQQYRIVRPDGTIRWIRYGKSYILDPTPEQAELIKASKLSTQHLLQVLNNILDYSKIEAQKLKIEKTEFKLDELVDEVLIMFKPSVADKSLILGAAIDSNLPLHVVGDSLRLKQILVNLVGNAVKFTPQGKVDVRMRKIEQLPDNKFKVECVVQDTGIGISESYIDDIFGSFSQADNLTTRPYGGTGLGLAICKSLAKLMQGDIWAESREGEGSCFHFTCVLDDSVEKENTGLSKVPENLAEMKNTGLKLLIVEDDEISRMVLQKFASTKGWQVVMAENGQEAIDFYRKDRFDSILMDIQMPVLDGFEATREIRRMESRQGSKIPIIAMTAYALEGDREKCLGAGMDDYLAKPVNLNEFYAKVERWALKNY